MPENRKQIIINEIIYWKKNNLLPEHYCNFLLALYTQGNGVQGKGKEKIGWKKLLYVFLFIPVIIFLLYFTELSFTLQIVFGSILIASGFLLTIFFRKKQLLYQIPLIISAFILLFTSVECTLAIFPNTLLPLYAVLSGNCLIWLLTGWKLKQLYLTLSGVIGILLIIISFFLPFSAL